MDEEINAFQEVKRDMIENRGFSISRIPKNTREEFIEYAKQEWADDRGALLNFLWKFFKGECNSGHEEINMKLDLLADEITKIKAQVQQKEEVKKVYKTMDGKVHE